MQVPRLRFGRSLLAATVAALAFTVTLALLVYALGDLNGVIDSIRNWVAGLLTAGADRLTR